MTPLRAPTAARLRAILRSVALVTLAAGGACGGAAEPTGVRAAPPTADVARGLKAPPLTVAGARGQTPPSQDAATAP